MKVNTKSQLDAGASQAQDEKEQQLREARLLAAPDSFRCPITQVSLPPSRFMSPPLTPSPPPPLPLAHSLPLPLAHSPPLALAHFPPLPLAYFPLSLSPPLTLSTSLTLVAASHPLSPTRASPSMAFRFYISSFIIDTTSISPGRSHTSLPAQEVMVERERVLH